MIVRYRAEALADIDDIFNYLHERSPSGARNVLYTIYDAIAEISEQPLANRQTDEPGIRVKITTRYRYNIFYGVENDAVTSSTSATCRGGLGPNAPSAWA